MDHQLQQWSSHRPEDWQVGGRCEVFMWGGGRHGQLAEVGRSATSPQQVSLSAITNAQQVHRVKQSVLTLKVLVVTIDAQWEGMGGVESARYEPALLPPCPTIRVLSYSN